MVETVVAACARCVIAFALLVLVLSCGRAPLGGDPDVPVTPAPLRPWNGESTGSVYSESALRPMFRWSASAQATEYDLDIDDACPLQGFANCAFVAPGLAPRGIVATSFQPSLPLDVDISPPVGRRYFWRVRACNDHGCSPWSAIRYVNVGRQVQDFDGDGYADLLVSAPGIGQALLYDGGPTLGNNPSPGFDSHLSGDNPQATWAGDVNGDGFGDIIGGSWAADGVPARSTLTFGHAGAPVQSDLIFDQSKTGNQPNLPLAGAGDMDADGFSDVAFGWFHPSGQSGRATRGVVVYLGGSAMDTIPDLAFVEPEPDMAFTLSPAGDYDGDGYADLAVGSVQGRVDVVWGGAHLSPVATTLLTGEATGTGQGSCAGDLNGDGLADLVIGAPGLLPRPPGQEGLPGRVTVIFGDAGRLARERLTIAGPQGFDFFGYAITARNDVDGDGYSDLVVGAPITDDTLGAIYVFRGGPSPSINADLVLPGTVSGSQFGRYIAATGDLDGDGFSDLAVGAPAVYSNTPGVFGRVYVYAGADADLSRSPTILTQGQTGDYFGGPVASAPP